MLLKEIKKDFVVNHLKDDKYLLSSITEHGVFPHKYLCTITKISSNCFQVENCEPTLDYNEFLKNINDYLNSLEYDSEYNNPLFREDYKYELFIHRLLNKNGFKFNDNYTGSTINIETYINKNPNIFGGEQPIIISIISSKNEFEIKLITGDYSGISINVNKDFKSIEEGLVGLLKPLYLTNGVINLQKSEALGESTNDIEYILTELKGFDIKQKDYKETLKNKLIELANSL